MVANESSSDVMIYDVLADYYDALVADETATQLWIEFIKQHTSPDDFLEVACGSGAISIALANQGYQVDASDLSEAMLNQARKKDLKKQVKFFPMDMLSFNLKKKYPSIGCFCDSLNYLSSLDDVTLFFQQAYQHLLPNGVLLFDCLSIDRLTEFSDSFIEEGIIKEVAYQWSIDTVNQTLQHHFAFWKDDQLYQEYHIQTIYSPQQLTQQLIDIGFTVTIYTDFVNLGVLSGERYCFVARKQEK